MTVFNTFFVPVILAVSLGLKYSAIICFLRKETKGHITEVGLALPIAPESKFIWRDDVSYNGNIMRKAIPDQFVQNDTL